MTTKYLIIQGAGANELLYPALAASSLVVI